MSREVGGIGRKGWRGGWWWRWIDEFGSFRGDGSMRGWMRGRGKRSRGLGGDGDGYHRRMTGSMAGWAWRRSLLLFLLQ